MNILYITHCDPRKTDFGSAQRTHLLWKALQPLGTVYTVYNVGPCEALVKDDEAKIASWHLTPTFKPWLYFQVLFSQWAAPAAWPFRKASFIRRQMPWRGIVFDVVVVRYLNSVAYARAWTFGPVYVDVDDLPLESYDTVYSKGHNKLMARFWHGVVAGWQRAMLKKCKRAWIANAAQAQYVQRVVPCTTLPNLAMMPKPGYQVNGKQNQQLMTVGLMGYEPNYEGVDWFVTHIWPAVRAEFPEMTYVVAGKDCPECLRQKWSLVSGVKVLGFVDDLDALYESSLAVVTPVMSGAGTCIKVMEAALHGRQVFATEFALRGYDSQTCEQLRIMRIASADAIVTALRKLRPVSRDDAQTEIMKCAQAINAFDCFSAVVAQVLK